MSVDIASSRLADDVEVRLMFSTGPQTARATSGNEVIDISLQYVHPLSVLITKRDVQNNEELAPLGPPVMVGGVETWDASHTTAFVSYPGRQLLVVRTPTCVAYLDGDKATGLTVDALRAIVASAHFASCADRSTWDAAAS